jgi:hypothetical protein
MKRKDRKDKNPNFCLKTMVYSSPVTDYTTQPSKRHGNFSELPECLIPRTLNSNCLIQELIPEVLMLHKTVLNTKLYCGNEKHAQSINVGRMANLHCTGLS